MQHIVLGEAIPHSCCVQFIPVMLRWLTHTYC